jgi:hypothetical protein
MVSRHEQKGRCHVVAQTVLARQSKEEFALIEPFAIAASVSAKLTRLLEHLLVCNGSGNTCHRNCEQQQQNHLRAESLHLKERHLPPLAGRKISSNNQFDEVAF